MENNKIKNLGKKLVELRKNKGMTQTELADKMFITHQAISQWENEQTIPDIVSLLKLCEIFNITLNDIFEQKTEEVHKMQYDNVIRIFAVKNGKLLKSHELNGKEVKIIFKEKIEGSVESSFSVECENVGGNIKSGSYVECGNVEGNVTSGSYVECGNVGNDVKCASYLECGDIGGNAMAGSYIECRKIGGSATATVINM